ncbi:MAG: T9SS type A sorting domain-containing protein [Candidatus Lokiarchaeota archaeon]|nr:T9SS type A sorting domain-containing protein [Candidatus Lokiarchaeota archaeon]
MFTKSFLSKSAFKQIFILLITILSTPLFSQNNSVHFPEFPIINFAIGSFEDIITSDFNGDGLEDVAVARYGGSRISIVLNETESNDIRFSSITDFAVDPEPFCLVSADFDNDGKNDIITANKDSANLSILRNTGDGETLSFEITTIPNIVTFPNIQQLYPCLTVADFNDDGLQDFVVASSTGKLIVFKNISVKGKINFEIETELIVDINHCQTYAHDFDNDGKIDLAMYSTINYSVKFIVFPNTSSQDSVSFGAFESFGGGMSCECASGDFDNDGKIDIARLDFGEINLIRNKSIPGDFSFELEWQNDYPIGFGGFGDKIHAVDLNNDELLDIVIVNRFVFFDEARENNYMSILINTSTEDHFNFKPFQQYGVAEDPLHIASADLDNDGLNDLIIGHNWATGFAVLHNQSSNDSLQLNSAKIFPVNFPEGPPAEANDIPYPCPINGADFNGDKLIDIAIASYDDNSFRIFKNSSSPGDLIFKEDVGYSTGLQPIAVETADFNNDSKNDIIIANEGANMVLDSGSLSIYKNESTLESIKFDVESLDLGTTPYSMNTGFFDLDNKLDLFVGISGDPFILRNTSDSEEITFEKAWEYEIPSGSIRMISSAVADYNQDGLMDIAVSDGMMHKVHVFQNQTTNETLDFKYLGKLSGYFPGTECIKTDDLDGDGLPDIVIAWQDYPCGCSILRNISTLDSVMFSEPITFQPLSNPSSLYLTDLTDDQKIDIIVGDPFSRTTILENKSVPGTIHFELAIPNEIILGDIKGDYNYYVTDFDDDGFKEIAAPRSDQQELWILQTFSSVPVPVELAQFSAMLCAEGVKLLWTSYSESNNYGYEVERSKDGHGFKKIAFISGNNFSNEIQEYSFTDPNITNSIYFYRLKQIDNDGSSSYSSTIKVITNAPLKYDLSDNYPNPFNGHTTIEFTLPTKCNTSISIYNISGKLIEKLYNGIAESGKNSVTWNGKARFNNDVSSGIYIYRIEAKNFSMSKKMLLIK